MFDIKKLKNEIYIFNHPVKIHDDCKIHIQNKVDKFVEAMDRKNQSSSNYRENRNARCPSKDQRIGKFGEIVAWHFLTNHYGFPIKNNTLDFEVREGHNKGWKKDLIFGSSDYPDSDVKTCDKNTLDFIKDRTGDPDYSWTFQFSSPRDPLFDNIESEDLVLFVYVSDVNLTESILMATAPWKKIVFNGILKPPIADIHKGRKLCVYYKDLLKYNEQTKTNF